MRNNRFIDVDKILFSKASVALRRWEIETKIDFIKRIDEGWVTTSFTVGLQPLSTRLIKYVLLILNGYSGIPQTNAPHNTIALVRFSMKSHLPIWASNSLLCSVHLSFSPPRPPIRVEAASIFRRQVSASSRRSYLVTPMKSVNVLTLQWHNIFL